MVGYSDEILQIIHSDGLPVDVPLTFFWKYDPHCLGGSGDDLIDLEVRDDAATKEGKLQTLEVGRAWRADPLVKSV